MDASAIRPIIAANRERIGTTLNEVRARINEPVIHTTIDDEGKITEVVVRNQTLCTERRREFVALGLIAPYTPRNVRRKRNRYATVGTKGTKKPKKSWHRGGDRLTAAARKADAKVKAKKGAK